MNTTASSVDISVVVPVYNSEATLEPLTERILAVLAQMGKSGEIIFVDDGSSDGSWEVLENLAIHHPANVVAVQLRRNFGQHNAIMCGFGEVRGSIVVTMDDDLQNPPEEITKLVGALENSQYDVIYAQYGKRYHAGWRNFGSRTVQAFYRYIFQTDISPNSFRALRSELLPELLNYQLNYTYIDGLLNWCTTRIGAVRVKHAAREVGRSGYSVKTLLLLALNVFTNFSIMPLQLVSVMGVLIALLGLMGAVFYLVQYAVAQIVVPGFATIVIVILVVGGAQMLALGIIGEYLGRLHLNMNRKPQYIVRQRRGRPVARTFVAAQKIQEPDIDA
ncbi:glycosyltransferase family 2 protein [Marimonas sp. MJW-29]|uniref:Glycosyltransferase family 2 protein n=1 Tax=Sulfitobacter sediminis TaxID=3234186 RepID=A0ABV3RP58_9RHOB